MSSYLNQLAKNRFLKFGIPFITLLVAGSFGLKEFAQLRYTFRKNEIITEREAKKRGLGMKPSEFRTSIEVEAQKLASDAEDLDAWSNIRGPRPWENSKQIQDEQRNKKT